MALRTLAGTCAVALAIASPALGAFPQSAPNDPLFDASPLPNSRLEQWDLASPAGGFDRGISADRAWPLSTGSGVVIADIDVGVDLSHPDLAGQLVRAEAIDGRGPAPVGPGGALLARGLEQAAPLQHAA